MTNKIPLKIRQNAVEYYIAKPSWSLGQIAKHLGISKTTMFNIIESKGKEDPEFVLARHLAVNLDKNGTSIREYAGGIRVSKLFEEYGIAQEEGEEMIQQLLVALHKEHWKPADAIADLSEVSKMAYDFGFTPLKLMLARAQYKQIINNKNRGEEELATFVRDHKVIRDNYQEFTRLGGVSAVFSERDEYKQKYENECKLNGKSVDKAHLDKLNRQLVFPATENAVLEKSNDIRTNPLKNIQFSSMSNCGQNMSSPWHKQKKNMQLIMARQIAQNRCAGLFQFRIQKQ
jgi:DNA-binding XRE family transcriptional regulator